MGRSRGFAGVAMGATTALAWGGMFAVGKSALSRVDAFHLTLARYGAASLVFLTLLVWREGRAAVSTEGRRLEVFLLGSVGFAGFNLPAYVALDHMPAQSASLVVATMPLVGALIAWAATRVRPPAAVVVAGLVALVGVGLVLSRGRVSGLVHGTAGRGSLLVLAGVIGWVVYSRGAARFPGWSPLRYTTLTAAAGTVTILAATLAAERVGYIGRPGVADYVAVLPQLLYVVLVAGVLAVLTWNGAVRALGPLNATLFINGVPLTAFAVEIARGYQPGPAEVVGALLTVAAVVGANVALRRAGDRVTRRAGQPRGRAVPPAGQAPRRRRLRPQPTPRTPAPVTTTR